MPIKECELPPGSAIDRQMVERAFFRDACRVPLTQAHASVGDLFFAIFGHHPWWMKGLLIGRNRVAAWCGLEVATVADILRPERQASYQVGDKIGPWPLYVWNAEELVAGRDNKHLDFRVSVYKQTGDGVSRVVVSTICTTHNLFGRLYLRAIIPFHRRGVRWLLSRAVAAGRL